MSTKSTKIEHEERPIAGLYPTYQQYKALSEKMTMWQKYQWTLDLMEVCLPPGQTIPRRATKLENPYAKRGKGYGNMCLPYKPYNKKKTKKELVWEPNSP